QRPGTLRWPSLLAAQHLAAPTAAEPSPLPPRAAEAAAGSATLLTTRRRGSRWPSDAVSPAGAHGPGDLLGSAAPGATPVHGLPGADNIRKYWSRYYQGSQGVIFVLDSASSEDDLETARNELHSALQHPQLCTLPFLILANHQDKPAARSVQEIKKYFELEPLARGKRWILKPCSLDDMEAVKDSFSLLINLLEERDFEPSRM
uniref:ADP-ribosylation factor-like protein 15 n=1 Tax=Calidris pygmaea TaxID=425635 RepID=A0A8C3PKN4_9CHAR